MNMQSHFIGCLLGVAIGDALGAPVEFLNAEEIKQLHGRVTDYLGGDADTVGAVCGALAGAYYGKEAVPQRWLETLSGRGFISSPSPDTHRCGYPGG